MAQTVTESACNAGDRGLIPVSKDPLEKEMAIHSSVLAWRIPWTEKPGGISQIIWSFKILDAWALPSEIPIKLTWGNQDSLKSRWVILP